MPHPPFTSRRHGARTTGHLRVALARRVLSESGMAPSRYNVVHASCASPRADRGVHGACRPYRGAGVSLNPSPAVASAPSPTLHQTYAAIALACSMCGYVFLLCTGGPGAVNSTTALPRRRELQTSTPKRHTSPPPPPLTLAHTHATHSCVPPRAASTPPRRRFPLRQSSCSPGRPASRCPSPPHPSQP